MRSTRRGFDQGNKKTWNKDKLVFLNSIILQKFSNFYPGVDSASNRNEYQESLKIKKPVGKVRQARRADNLAAIY
jgi:hypothetical protein